MIRSILAIAVGFFYIAALSTGADALLMHLRPGAVTPSGVIADTGILLLMMTCVAVFAISGCYIAARLAPSRPMRHALILGALGLLVNIGGAIAL